MTTRHALVLESSPIVVRGLVKQHGERRVLDGLDLSVEPGSVFRFLGANGAGKTNTIRILLGATGIWAALATVLIAASLVASAAFDAMAAAAGIGIGTFFLLTLAGMAPRLAEFTPTGLIPAASAVATGASPGSVDIWWPVATGLVLATLILATAVFVFHRKELR